LGSVYLTQNADYTNLWKIIVNKEDCYYRFEVSIKNNGTSGGDIHPFECLAIATVCNRDGYTTTVSAKDGEN